ncbi:hypothetical protein SAMN05192569_102225 [Parageobacillus thermantarcticus]|uniref:Uncharacterized protein n=1 Tax=Parageobacillus thermantarcticus TaxID=186116 RepID=A0A1I0TD11_9BACL|nr:hypothetical protein SAMN05192569_102225 [Parageobacillus thermantarcticus]
MQTKSKFPKLTVTLKRGHSPQREAQQNLLISRRRSPIQKIDKAIENLYYTYKPMGILMNMWYS